MADLDLSTPCVPWPGCKNRDGYGQIRRGGRTIDAHRYVFEQAHGAIPAGIEVGHACHDADLACAGGIGCPHRSCVNLLHLVGQTRSENQRGGVLGRRTSCVNGHRYDEANTYRAPSGRRDCRACIRDRVRRYIARKAAA